jgi:hypothetical protein
MQRPWKDVLLLKADLLQRFGKGIDGIMRYNIKFMKFASSHFTNADKG